MISGMRRVRRFVRRTVQWAKHNRKQFFIVCGIAVLVVFVGIPGFTYAYFAKDLGSKESIITRNEEGVTLLDRKNKPFYTLYDAKKREYIPLDQISENLQKAVIASEDRDFYEHPGFSIRGIGRAFMSNITSGSISQGASTITQQLVKNVLLSHERSFLRKFQEVVLAIEIDRRYSKKDILEMYLNAVYFGEGAFGAQEAAQAYFGKDASELTLAEAALLSGVLPAPSAYSPISGDRAKAMKRKNTVLQLMQEQGVITAAQRKKAQDETISFEKSQSTINEVAPHYALMVKDELIKKYGEGALAQSGFRVQTTLDLDLQRHAQDAVESHVQTLARNKATNGALVAIDPDSGEVLALVGSHDWADEDNGKINMAVSPRQPGSSFKPLVYGTAIEEKLITAGTIMEDKEKDFGGGYRPQNYDRKERGNVSIRRALATSLNIPAVEVMEKVGVSQMLRKAENDLGITTLTDDQDYGLSLVLGSGAVPLIQMTNAFAAFANEGIQNDTSIIMQVRDKRERVIFRNQTDSHTAFSREAAYIISSILSDAGSRTEVFGTALNISRQAAVKTGTTNDYKDALTIGYTPQIVVGVWVGNNDNKAMDSVAGSLGAAPIWKDVMEYALQDEPVEWFSKPSGVTETRICAQKGLLVEGFDDKKNGEIIKLKEGDNEVEYNLAVEVYIKGTEPTKKCTPETPTPDPTKEAEDKKKRDEEEQKKKDDEDKKKKDEDAKKNPTATPRPSNTPTASPTISVPTPTETETIVPTTGVTGGPTISVPVAPVTP